MAKGRGSYMKAQNLASILIYMAVLFHLIVMSGWFHPEMLQPLQLASLGLMLAALFVLRKKKRKTKRRPRKPPAEVGQLLERSEESKEGSM